MSKKAKIKRLKERIRGLEGRPSLPALISFEEDRVTVHAPGVYHITSLIRLAGREFGSTQVVTLSPGVYPIDSVIRSVRLP